MKRKPRGIIPVGLSDFVRAGGIYDKARQIVLPHYEGVSSKSGKVYFFVFRRR